MNDNTIVFEPQILLDKLEGDDELARELLEAFSEDAPLRLESLKQAAQAGDSPQAAEAAHSLKGMCGVVRVQQLVDLALSMECSSRDCDMDKVRSVLGKFEFTLGVILVQVKKYLEG